MKMNNILAMIPGCRLCLLGSAGALMVLLLWSQLSDIGRFPGTKYADLVPRKSPSKGPNAPPVLAYWILGSKGENKRILRLLRAIYHPRNEYLLQLDSSAADYERMELALFARSQKVLREFGNVNVVGKSYGVNQMGASGLAAVLHGAALMMRISGDWDWFVPLSSSDYPLWTQDDILYAFSPLPRDLNFVAYTNDTALSKTHNLGQIVIDPNLHLKHKAHIFYAPEIRQKPDAFGIFVGSSWMILSRGFLDHCVNGWDNLPRKLLMYFTNTVAPAESYFQTLLCNSPEFQSTVVGHNLRCIVEDGMRVSDPRVAKEAIFAGPFKEDDPMMQEIDERMVNGTGKWCGERGENGGFCSVWGDVDVLEVGGGGVALRRAVAAVVAEMKGGSAVCRRRVAGE